MAGSTTEGSLHKAGPLDPQTTVAVIGAGTMGAGIAQVAAQSGHRVLLIDARPGAAVKAVETTRGILGRLVEKGRLTASEAAAIGERLGAVDSMRELASAGLLIEAIVEDLEVKRKLFAEIEAIVDDRAIIASNTSSLSITALAGRMNHPGRLVGMHFFNPVPLMALVEVVSGIATEPAVAKLIHATASAWGKSPVFAKSTPGFIVNRVARPFYLEALRLLQEHAAGPATIDALMREAGGFRMGPFELMDLIGLDVNLAVTQSVWNAYFNDPRYAPSLIQQELVESGRLGRKSGRGFYEHAPGAAQPAPAIAASGVRPASMLVAGSLGFAAPLAERIAKAGIAVRHGPADAVIGDGYLLVGSAVLAPSDGRTATRRALDSGHSNLVLFDLALDYTAAARLALARADQCSDAAWAEAVGLLQAVGIQVSPVDDVAGLVVMRTVSMLANEAADAVCQGVASGADIDVAMRKGVNYPEGPLAWADRVGPEQVARVVAHLAAHYGGHHYRLSSLLSRRAASGRRLRDA